MKPRNQMLRFGAGAALASLAAAANAAPVTIDVSDVVGTITAGIVTLTSIGTAVLSVVVLIKLFGWASSAIKR